MLTVAEKYTWSSDAQISNSGVDCSYPDVCLAGDTVHVIWESGYRRSTDAGTTWDAIDTEVSGDAIAAGGGKVCAMLDSASYSVCRIYLRRFNGTSWEPAVRLCGDSNCQKADVATDGNHVYVTWTQDMDGDGWNEDIHFRRSSDGGASWDTIRRLTALGHNLDLYAPRLAAGNNCVQLVWAGDRDAFESMQAYWQQSLDNGGTWSHCHRLTYDSLWSELPAVAFAGDTIHAVWDRLTPDKSVYYIYQSAPEVSMDEGRSLVRSAQFALVISPNPFTLALSPSISYFLPVAGKVNLKLCDVTGRQVRMLVNAEQGPGRYTLRWNGRDEQGALAPEGVYFCRMSVPEARFSASRKLMLTR